MSNRRSFDIDGYSHGNPIPAVSRVGNIVMTGGISGINSDKTFPADINTQARQMFATMKRIVEAAGATMDDVIKITVWLRDPAAQRAALNEEWVKVFPDEHSRPARHVMRNDYLAKDMLIQCDAMAVVSK